MICQFILDPWTDPVYIENIIFPEFLYTKDKEKKKYIQPHPPKKQTNKQLLKSCYWDGGDTK